MSEIEIKDRLVQYPRRYQLQAVEGAADTYDLIPVPGTITEAGTPINRMLLEPMYRVATAIDASSNLPFFNPHKHSQTFTASGTFTVPAGVSTVDVWLVGGGGGSVPSGSNFGGGAGGGYCKLEKNISVTPGQGITVAIGAGGSGTDGGSTSFGSYSVAGGKANDGRNGGDGGSGGGSWRHFGGAGGTWGECVDYNTPASRGGSGQGFLQTVNPYDGIVYAGGGGGCGCLAPDGGAGYGGGGAGGNSGNSYAGGNGTNGLGGGAGGAGNDGGGGTGGSGICIVYWD